MTLSSVELGELFGLAAALAWGTTGLLVRAHGAGVHAIVINAMRCGLSGVAFIFLWLFTSNHAAVPPTALLFLGASMLMGLGLGDSMYFEALKRIGVSRAMPISMGYPVLASIGAVVLLHESMSLLSVLGMIVTLGGVYLVAARPEPIVGAESLRSSGYWLGVGLAAAAAVSWSCSTLALRPALDLVDVATAGAIRTPLASALLFLTARRARVLPKAEYLYGRALIPILLTGLASVGATWFFLISVALAGAGRAAVLSATAPVFGVPLSMLLGERGNWRILTGTLASVLGVILLARG